ncbi:MAG: transcriptional regulator [Negativicutes bacterium]|nr:transcriptional regulator [Negativicutes bacterium]
MLNSEAEKAILTRLKTVKGHISGIERMVENKEDCADILVQISATRSAIEKIGIYLLENNARDCLCAQAKSVEEKEHVQKVVKQIISFLK